MLCCVFNDQMVFTLYMRDDVHDMRIFLDDHDSIQIHRSRRAHPIYIVSPQIYKHHLLYLSKEGGKRTVLLKAEYLSFDMNVHVQRVPFHPPTVRPPMHYPPLLLLPVFFVFSKKGKLGLFDLIMTGSNGMYLVPAIGCVVTTPSST